MRLYDEAQRLRCLAKHVPDQLDADEVRAFARRVMTFLEELDATLEGARVEIPGERLSHLLDGMLS